MTQNIFDFYENYLCKQSFCGKSTHFMYFSKYGNSPPKNKIYHFPGSNPNYTPLPSIPSV